MFPLAPIYEADVKKFGGKRRPNVMHKFRFTPPGVRQHFLAPVIHTGIPVGYARKISTINFLNIRTPKKFVVITKI